MVIILRIIIHWKQRYYSKADGRHKENARGAAAGVLFLKSPLPFPEGLAVCALVHRRIVFVRTDSDAVERTIIRGGAMICTLGNGAFNALVGLAVIHLRTPPFKVLCFCKRGRNPIVTSILVYPSAAAICAPLPSFKRETGPSQIHQNCDEPVEPKDTQVCSITLPQSISIF